MGDLKILYVSEDQAERFHMETEVMEELYQGR